MYKNKDSIKIIKEWSLNHKIYTPHKSILQNIQDHDRPFAGLLFLKHAVLKTDKKRYVKNKEYHLGMMGPSAFGEELQTFIHDIYGFVRPIGWKYQIKNSLAVQYKNETVRKIDKNQKQFFDFYYSYGFNVGTIYTNTEVALQGRIGFKQLADFDTSLAFGTHLENGLKPRAIESMLFWKISNCFVIYDATLQGGLFDTKSPLTFTPNRFQFSFEFGYLFTAKNWNFGYSVIYNTNEKPNLTNNQGHYYATIFISKLFN